MSSGYCWRDVAHTLNAEEAMVAELVRRHGADWLDAQLSKLRQRREG